MIEEQAQVVEAGGGYAWVETQRKSSCGSCSAQKGCGAGALSQVMGTRSNRMRVLNPVDAVAGDQVVIGIDEGALVGGSLAVYTMPLLMMLGGALLGIGLAANWGGDRELFSMLGGIAGLAGGFLWLTFYSRRIAHDRRFQPVILRRLAGIPITRIDACPR